MTPVKTNPYYTNRGGLFFDEEKMRPGTGTVSGMIASIDGDEFDYRLNSERDEDNVTLKNSETYKLLNNANQPNTGGQDNQSIFNKDSFMSFNSKLAQ